MARLRLLSLLISLMLSLTLSLRLPSRALRSAAKKGFRLTCVGAEQLSTSASSGGVGRYDHTLVEAKWQKFWEEKNVFQSVRREGKEKRYVLDMFPYPSGSGLHVGHPEGYTATDIMARYWRMRDFDVLHPMGWDAFGLPAEQHAINTGTHPAITTYENIATFKRQLKSLGFSYDWSRELSTTDDKYVKWTQWIFLQLFKAGLAAQSEVNVNWCPALGTVLSNEEVIDGLSERGNHPVVRQPLRQWVLQITKYADKLEEGLEGMQWPEGTLSAQKQWIGRSEGASIRFKVEGSMDGVEIEVFTTRADTLMGVTYLVLAPELDLVKALTSPSQREAVEEYTRRTASKSDLERTSVGKDKGKTGVALGAFAIHPLNGQRIPIWTADYVLAGYGTGAVMAVPAHDERDFEFAATHQLPVVQVVWPANETNVDLPFTDEGFLGASSGSSMDGLSSEEARHKVMESLASKGMGGSRISYRLRDWVFSRQRYWGEPIPIYFPVELAEGASDPKSDAHVIRFDQPMAVSEDELPLRLPEMENFQPGDDPLGCLARAKDWRYFERDGQWFARETNTMPQWAGSCWYYLRFTDPSNEASMLSKEGASWLPVDLYVGGQEHAVLHLLYARFWHKVLFDLGLVDHPEPFRKLVHQGMILGTDGEKMSKSRGNVINPDDVVREHGADALRLYEMFMGPLEAVKPWQTGQLQGVVRFRDKVFNLVKGGEGISEEAPSGAIEREMHKTIKKVTGDIEALSFNTAISTLMIFTNSLIALKAPAPRRCLQVLVQLLSPFAPHVAEECWQMLSQKEGLESATGSGITYEPWPSYDEALCVDTTAVIAIQINGKVRAKVEMEKDLPEADAISLALAQQGVLKYVSSGEKIKKAIYVPGRILNLLV